MKRFEQWFARWVIAWRWWILALTPLVVLAAASGGRNLEFTTNYRVFFSEDNPQMLAFEALENTYAKNDNVLFVLAPADGDAASRAALEAVEYLTERAWQIPFSTRVDSITNFQHMEAEGDDLVVRDLVEDAAGLDDAAIEQAKAIALREPRLARRLVSPTAHVTGVNVTVQMPRENEVVEVPQVVSFARGLADEVRERFPGVEVHISGLVMMNNAFSESSMHDMATLVPLSFAIMAIMLGMLTRGFVGTAVTVTVIALAILFAMGLGGWVGFPLTPPSATAPTIILTVAIANCVHILVTFMQRVRAGDEKRDALVESLRVNLQPVFLASLTTALGFMSMNFSEVPPFRHLGTFVAFGVGASFVLSVTFLPAALAVLPSRIRAAGDGRDRLMAAVGAFVVRRRTALLWTFVALIGVLVASISRNELNDVFVRYFDETVEFRRAADFTVDNLTGIYTMEYSLESGESGGVSEPAFLDQLARFVEWYRERPQTIHVNTITDTFKSLNQNMNAGAVEAYRLPQERDLAAQYLLLYEMSLPYGLDLNNQINVDKSSTRLIVTTETLSSNEVLGLDARAQAWLAANAPDISGSEGTGTTLMFAHIGERNIRAMLIGTTVALIGISIVLILAFRSLRIGLVSLVPNLVPGAMGFGVWGLAVGEVGLSLSVVTSMTLGIVVDDTVHFLSKYLRARRELGHSPGAAVRYAFETVGRALVITSIVLVAGFLVLSLSSFELNAGMGLLTALVIALALAADFLFLPPLLMKIEGERHEDTAVGAAADRTPA